MLPIFPCCFVSGSRNIGPNERPIAGTRFRVRQDPETAHQGFTLLEILVAIFIFSVISLVVFGTYRGVFSSTDRIDWQIQAEEMAGVCFHRVLTDLTAIHVSLPPAYGKPDAIGEPDPFRLTAEVRYVGTKAFPLLRFVSREHVGLGADPYEGIAEIVYYVGSDDGNGYVWRRSDRIDFDDAFTEKRTDPVLCEQLRSLTITYLDENGEYHDTWDSDSEDVDYATPHAVNIELEIGSEEQHHAFRMMVHLPVFREKIESFGPAG